MGFLWYVSSACAPFVHLKTTCGMRSCRVVFGVAMTVEQHVLHWRSADLLTAHNYHEFHFDSITQSSPERAHGFHSLGVRALAGSCIRAVRESNNHIKKKNNKIRNPNGIAQRQRQPNSRYTVLYAVVSVAVYAPVGALCERPRSAHTLTRTVLLSFYHYIVNAIIIAHHQHNGRRRR